MDEGRVEGGWMLTCGDASVADGGRTNMGRARDKGDLVVETTGAKRATREAMQLTC